MNGIRICGTGSYLPPVSVENEAFTSIVETSDEWIRTRTGIASRHIADRDSVSGMGAKAAGAALEQAGISPEQIDLLIVTTITADCSTPSTACIIQGLLGAENAMCFDVNAACAGFVYALDMARRYLCFPDVQTALVISTEALSRITNYEDRSTCVLFGDGAGAVVVQAADTPYGSHLGADGKGAPLIFSKNMIPKTPFSKEAMEESEFTKNPVSPCHIFMDGKETYKFSTRVMPLCIEESCKTAGVPVMDLSWIIPHQANYRIVQTAMKNLGLPMERAYINIDHVGNTSSASIPIALDELHRSGKLERGQKIAVTGFGAGLVYAGAVFEW